MGYSYAIARIFRQFVVYTCSVPSTFGYRLHMSTTHCCWVGISLSIPCIHVRVHSTSPFPLLYYRHLIASLYRQHHLTPKFFTLIQHISRTMTSFNERRGASSSEGGGEFEFRVFVYLPTFFFFCIMDIGDNRLLALLKENVNLEI